MTVSPKALLKLEDGVQMANGFQHMLKVTWDGSQVTAAADLMRMVVPIPDKESWLMRRQIVVLPVAPSRYSLFYKGMPVGREVKQSDVNEGLELPAQEMFIYDVASAATNVKWYEQTIDHNPIGRGGSLLLQVTINAIGNLQGAYWILEMVRVPDLQRWQRVHNLEGEELDPIERAKVRGSLVDYRVA
jgi:hypothetical protein